MYKHEDLNLIPRTHVKARNVAFIALEGMQRLLGRKMAELFPAVNPVDCKNDWYGKIFAGRNQGTDVTGVTTCFLADFKAHSPEETSDKANLSKIPWPRSQVLP